MTKEEALVKIYEEAMQRLYSIITSKAAKGQATAHYRSLLKQVTAETKRLQSECAGWVGEAIPDTYYKAFEGISAQTPNIAGMNSVPASVINKKAVEALMSDSLARLSIANSTLASNIKGVITEKMLVGETVKQTRNRIVESIYGAQGQGKMNINGRAYDPVKYAEMVARTSTREATNTASMNSAVTRGNDLLKMSSHNPTCNICAPLQGRVYSISGTSDKYPPLEAAWGTEGYATIHPNCRHVFSPYIEALKTPEELAKIQEFSNRPFDVDPRSKRGIEAYDKGQRKKAKLWSDKQQYERYKARLGTENVPKSFSGFRRMKASGNDNWQELQSSYRAALPTKAAPKLSSIEAKVVKIDEILAKEMVGSTSEWSGKVKVVDGLLNDKGMHAYKDMTTKDIVVDKALKSDQILVHEVVHTRMPTPGRALYMNYTGMEEGFVESMAAEITKAYNLSGSSFKGYKQWTDVIEEVAKLKKKTVLAYSKEMLKHPLAKRVEIYKRHIKELADKVGKQRADDLLHQMGIW